MRTLITPLKKLILFTLLLTSGIAFGQKEAYRWYFGRKAGFDFTTTPPTMLSNGPFPGTGNTDEAHASISDKNGNYLFYTNGINIWDKTGTQMPNGSGLLGDVSTTQCATVFPVPGSTTDYYVLTTPLTGTATGLLWNKVDITANSGNGDIKAPVASNKNQAMPSCPKYMMECVVSVPHSNGTDIWVIAHSADDPSTVPNEGGSFVVWLVSASGIAYSNTYTLGYAYPYDNSAVASRGIGILKANNCFTQIFISYYNASSRVEGFSFSNSSGIVSNWPAPVSGPLVIDQYKNSLGNMTSIGSFSYGLEISGNGRYLYNTISGETGPKELTQYDLQAGTGTTANIVNSAVRLTPSSPGGDRYGQLQMGPDGKIYHTLFNWDNIGGGGYCIIGTIDAPNTGGTGATFNEQKYVWPNTATGVGSSMGLTSFHRGFIASTAAISSSFANLQQICLGDNVDFTAQTGGSTITMYQWNIDKNLNNTIDFSGATTSSINYTYPATGSYTVELTVTNQCGYTSTSTSQVTVLPKPAATGSVSCGTPNVSLTVTSTPTAGNNYVWYSDAAGTTPIASGATATVPAPLIGNVYVKQVNTVTITPTVVTPAQSAATSSISSIQTTLPSATFDPATARITTLTVSRPLTLNSFDFVSNGQFSAATGSYTVTIKNSSGTVVNTMTVSATVDRDLSGFAIQGNTRALFTYAPAGGVSLTAGNYTVSLQYLSGPNGAMQIGEFDFGGLGSSSISGAISNSGDANSSSKTFITDISVSTPAVPAVMTNVITSTPLTCSVMSPAISASCPLPVSWLNFEAARNGKNTEVLLDWTTISEESSNLFYIQRSEDGINFETIGQLNASGNSSTIKNYQYIDKTASSGKLYYRIVEEDINGSTMNSAIKEVSDLNSLNIGLAPNPGNGNFKIIGVSEDVLLNVIIYSVTGQSIFTTTTYAERSVDLSGLAKGFYIVKVLAGNDAQSIRFLNQ